MAGPWSESRLLMLMTGPRQPHKKSILYPEVFILKSFAFSGAY